MGNRSLTEWDLIMKGYEDMLVEVYGKDILDDIYFLGNAMAASILTYAIEEDSVERTLEFLNTVQSEAE